MQPSGDRRTIVIGGGVIGVCCAYFLAKRGANVTVLERDEIARGASYGNAGTITPGHPPINKPGRIGQALRSLLHPLSPVYVAPRFDPALVEWLWLFFQKCTDAQVELSMRSLGPLGLLSRTLFDELAETEDLGCRLRHSGYYEIYLTKRGLESAVSESRMLSRHGFSSEFVGGEDLRRIEPAIHKQVLGGIFHPEAAIINPYGFVSEMAERTKRHGATIRTKTGVASMMLQNNRIRGVRLENGEFLETDRVVVAGGAYSTPLLEKLGIRFPLQAAKGYHRDCEPADGKNALLSHTCVLGESMVFCAPMDGFVRFAGTLELSGINHEIRRPRLEQITKAASRYLNTMRDARTVSEWCGLRPCLPDGLPAIGPVRRYPGLFVATGHAMMGITLGPATGLLIAESVLDGASRLDIAPFQPERFHE